MNLFILNMQRALSVLMLLAVVSASQAGSIQLTPVRINLSNAARVQILTVHNTGTEESVMQVTLNKWTLDGEQYSYVQSQDLVITPTTFRLAPGEQQIVRIGLRGSPPESIEDSYRLLVEEVPPPEVPGATGARMIVRHDLPVFVAPLETTLASLDIELECAADGSVLRVSNIGNVHAQLRSIVLEDSMRNQQLGSWEAFDYMLPLAQKSWVLAEAAPAVIGQDFGVTMLTDQGSFTTDVINSCL